MLATVISVVTAAVSLGSLNVGAYDTSGTWHLHYDLHDSKTYDYPVLVAYGNGYLATCTEKTGKASMNYVTISADYMDEVTITEIGVSTVLKPSRLLYDYVKFTVHYHYSIEGTNSNSGTIKIR